MLSKIVNSKEQSVNSKNIKSFTDLSAWKVGHELVLQVYKATKKFPKSELFGLVSQIRRAASSITANIAEGWGRYHFADKTRFYYQSRGSNAEVQNFLILSKDLGYLSGESYLILIDKAINSFRVINGLIRSVEKQK